jgi:hypothetical protein
VIAFSDSYWPCDRWSLLPGASGANSLMNGHWRLQAILLVEWLGVEKLQVVEKATNKSFPAGFYHFRFLDMKLERQGKANTSTSLS